MILTLAENVCSQASQGPEVPLSQVPSWFSVSDFLGPQVMFDYPTVADLTDFILSQFAPDDADDLLLSGGELSATREPLSMLGIAGRYPGMSAHNDVSEPLGKTICGFMVTTNKQFRIKSQT